MKHKIVILAITLLLILTTTSCGFPFYDEPTEIHQGFSSELTSYLTSRFQITIPKEAKFIKGLNTNAFRDPAIVILFEYPISEELSMGDDFGYSFVCQILKLDTSKYSFSWYDEKSAADWYDDFGGQFDHRIDYNDDLFTYISYSFGESTLTIRFVGRNPGKTFS